MLHSTISAKVNRALRTFARQETYPPNVNEKTLTGNLANYLKREFPSWDVDAEYDRDLAAQKKLKGKRVYPDIIVHHRQQKGASANLLVIEAKKSNNRDRGARDRQKLHDFHDDDNYRYQHCAFLIFSSAPEQPHKVEWLCCRSGISTDDGASPRTAPRPSR
jgi:hypothetical protein